MVFDVHSRALLSHWRWSYALLWLLAACRPASVTEQSNLGLELTPESAEVWTPSVSIVVRIRGRSAPARCELVQNGEPLSRAFRADGFKTELALSPGINRVSARCSDSRGYTFYSNVVSYLNRSVSWTAVPPRKKNETALDGAVIYGVLPPLFGSPPLRAVTQALPSLAELGITTLWLSPLSATPKGDYGYAVTDYFAVRSDYGTPEDLRALVARAHERGLRVLLDFVPNHTSARHPYYVEAQQLGPRSHYFHFYQRSASGGAVHYFDWEHLPNLDYTNPEVGAWISAAGAFWLRSFEVDGFRVDAAWGVAQRNPTFFDEWSRRLSTIRPVTLIAEASARDNYYLQHGFDAAYDWTSELGQWAWHDVFSPTPGVATRLSEALRATARASSRSDRVLRFINNNDTGTRFVTRHGLGMTRAATVLLFTVPGLPCLFSFDEVGGEFEPYAELGPIRAPRYPELRGLHQRLIALRREQAALRSAQLEWLNSGDPDVSLYLRPATTSGAGVLVAVSWSAQPRTLRVPWQALPGLARRGLRSLLSPEPQRTAKADELRIALGPFEFGAWVLENEPTRRLQ